MEDETREEIIKTFDFNHFSPQELASDVKKSGFFSTDQIIDRMEELHQIKDKELETKERELEIKKSRIREILQDMTTIRNKFDVSRSTYKLERINGPFVNLWEVFAPNSIYDKY